MKQQKRIRKLTLSKETIKELTDAEMSQAAGGATVIGSCRPNCFSEEGPVCTSLRKGNCY